MIGRIERESFIPSITQFEALANTLGFDITDMFIEKQTSNSFIIKTLIRFIARLQCTWWLPYRSLVKRLKEISAITNKQYEELYAINERDIDGEYNRVGNAFNSDVFLMLNTSTNTIGTSPKDIEIIIRNFEDNIIDEDAFLDTLNLFNKKPADFGYEIKISKEDIDEFENFFNGEINED